MNRIFLECAYGIETAATADGAWDHLIRTCARVNLPNVIYAMRGDDDPPDWHIRSTLPDAWPGELAENPEFSEPFVTYCCATFEITKIGPEYLDLNDQLIDEYARAYIQTASEYNWLSGIGIPTALRGSGRHGGFILGNAMKRYDFERSIMPLANDLRALCLIAGKRFETRAGPQPSSPPRPLSPRETQALDMLSKGLRPKRIAEVLGLKETSVRLYLKNAKSKLGAASNADAVRLFLRRK